MKFSQKKKISNVSKTLFINKIMIIEKKSKINPKVK